MGLSVKKTKKITIISSGGEQEFSSMEDLEEWTKDHPETAKFLEIIKKGKINKFTGKITLNKNNSEKEFSSFEDNNKISKAINVIKERLKISNELSIDQIYTICASNGLTSDEYPGVIEALKRDSDIKSRRIGAFGFLGFGELIFESNNK